MCINEKDCFKHFFPFFTQLLKPYDAITSVIIVYAWIEAQLTKLLLDRFVDSNAGKSLEDYQAWQRIDIAHKFGVISDDCRKDLDTVRKIRNCCAHCRLKIDKRQGMVMFDFQQDRMRDLATNITNKFQKFIGKYKDFRLGFPNKKIGEVVMIMVAMLTEFMVSKKLNFQHIEKPEREKFYIL